MAKRSKKYTIYGLLLSLDTHTECGGGKGGNGRLPHILKGF